MPREGTDCEVQVSKSTKRTYTPGFKMVVALEAVKGEKTLTQVANKSDAQFIVAVLIEKLDSSDLSKEEQASLSILQLAEGDMLFEGKPVDMTSNLTAKSAPNLVTLASA